MTGSRTSTPLSTCTTHTAQTMNPASRISCEIRCSTKNPLAEDTSIRKLPIQHVIQAVNTIPNAIIDCIAWKRTAGRSRSTSQTSAPLAHQPA